MSDTGKVVAQFALQILACSMLAIGCGETIYNDRGTRLEGPQTKTNSGKNDQRQFSASLEGNDSTGYYLALSGGEPGEVYNLGAERSYAIRELLEGLITLSEVSLTVELDPARLRPSDTSEIVADCTKFRSRTGWRAEIPLQCTLRDILDYWRENIRTSHE